jgi:hypothetical protein
MKDDKAAKDSVILSSAVCSFQLFHDPLQTQYQVNENFPDINESL